MGKNMNQKVGPDEMEQYMQGNIGHSDLTRYYRIPNHQRFQ